MTLTVSFNGVRAQNTKVSPVLECVREESDGSLTGFFGYNNQNAVEVDIPIGDKNYFTPGTDRGQPETFLPGRQTNAFTISFTSGNHVWTLKSPDGSTSTATAGVNSGRCVAPSATISGGANLCSQEEEVTIRIDLTGTGPWSVKYKDSEGITYQESNITTTPFEFTSSKITTYTLTEVKGFYNLQGTVSGSASIGLIEQPTATIEPGMYPICQNESIFLDVKLEGTAPFTLHVIRRDIANPNIEEKIEIENITDDQIQDGIFKLEVSQPGFYIADYIADATVCTGSAVTCYAYVYQSETPTATISGETVCKGDEATITIEFEGEAPFTFQITDAEGNQIEQVEETSTYSFTTTTPNVYTLDYVNDASCSGTVNGEGIAAFRELPTAKLSGNPEICEGSVAELQLELTGQGPWTVVYKDEEGNEFSLNDIQQNFFSFEVDKASVYQLISVQDQFCSGTVSGESKVSYLSAPTATLSGGGVFCEGNPANLHLNLTGHGPWTVVYQDGEGNETTIENIEAETYTLEVSEASTYSLVSVADNNCQGTVSGEATVKFNQAPTATLSGGGSFCQGAEADLNLELTGHGPWTVVYQNSEGHETTLENIEQENYTFTVTEPSTYSLVSVIDNSCDGIVSGEAVVSFKDSPTATLSGGEAICQGSDIELSLELTGSAPWTVVYQTSDGQETTLTGIDQENYSFVVSESSTYSLVSVTDQLCEGTVQGEAVVNFYPQPTAQLTGGGSICNGANTMLQLELTGEAPWTVVYQKEDGTPFTLSDINSSDYSFEVNSASNYSLVTVEDKNCQGTVSGEAIVSLSEPPTAEITGGGNLCGEAESTQISVHLTGTAPFSFTYTNGEKETEITGFNQSVYTFEASGNQTFNLISVQDQACTGSVSGEAKVKTFELPKVSFSLPEAICANQEPIELDQVEPPGGEFEGPGVNQNSFDPAQAGAGLHQITYTYTDENGCSNQATEAIRVNEIPTASITGGGTFCPGQEAELEVSLSGNGPFSFTYTDGTNETTVETEANTYTFSTSEAGTYELISVSDQSCQGDVTGEALVEINDTPIEVDFDPGEASCFGEEIALTPTVSGTDLTVNWSTTGAGTIVDPALISTTYIPAENETGTVTFTLNISNTCFAEEYTFSTEISEPVEASFSVQPGEENRITFTELTFNPENEKADSYQWNFGNGESSNNATANQTYTEEGEYIVSLTISEEGCEGTSEETITIDNNRIIYVPNIFSLTASNPENQVVKVYGEGISSQDFYFRIVNKWGNPMFETTDLSRAMERGWQGTAKGNGEIQPIGVYTFVLRGQFLDGETFEKTGTITLTE
ncbi:MAG: PKD domain-containing protein [Candidatus Cyclobacteriaceae bacterium M3_2C_046]